MATLGRREGNLNTGTCLRMAVIRVTAGALGILGRDQEQGIADRLDRPLLLLVASEKGEVAEQRSGLVAGGRRRFPFGQLRLHGGSPRYQNGPARVMVDI